ncbi:Conserved hypothetical protein DUF497 [Candidatus Glomeribacter gigasporarum BEG34]|uniref:BrnT family toxin n=1 Tax=Candidatus Glomeribacter gigasporarum BEG34 TaxID=1070319 RepID=G2JA44_9BURK|nr:BrnT family toxin [Candidatus Glomeribacter gigasporarum]CCD29643.1 Conserved hypothetical protein DUF497 [Candidatus Glomeribacter gigasporarum BEG34]
MLIRFEWDEAKSQSNQRKHGVSFEEACQVFRDPLHVSVQDRIEGSEQRWQTLGLVQDRPLLLVAHTLRDQEGTEIVRIISARKATPIERRRYEQENG